MYLFAADTNDVMPGRVEYCKHWESGVLVHHWRAAKDENGVACFYEEVSKTYEYGVGTFTAGASINGGSSGGSSTECNVTLTGTLDSERGYVTINGTKYSTAQTVTAKAGDTVYVYCYSSLGVLPPDITLNGTSVDTNSSSNVAEYTFALATDTAITFTAQGSGNESKSAAITTS
jgi:hypothetical protein